MQQDQNDEIDLLTFLLTIWDGKWKIVITTIVTFTIGTLYTINIPNSYEISSTLSNDNQNVFIKYKSLNDILQESRSIEYGTPDVSDKFEINGDVIVEMFTKEFNDYEEMISVLNKNDYVVNKIKNLNDFEKRKALVNFANRFKIIKETKNKVSNLKIVFKWHNIDNGISLTNKALKLTMLNVRDKLEL